MPARRATRVVTCALALAILTVPSAVAKPATPSLRVSPAAPTLATPITVSWRAGRAARYGATIRVRPASGVRLACSYGTSSVQRRVAQGGRLSATLKPTGDPEETRKWCPGPATVTIRRFPPASGPPVVVATRRITIHRGAGELAPGPADTPATIRLLAGSTLTVSAPGHADRSSAVNGVLRGFIPSPFRLNQDISITRAGGALVPVGLGADPLCPGTSPPFSFPVTTATTMTLSNSGHVTLALTLAGAPSQLSGCGPAGPLTGATTIQLTGQSGARGLLALNMDGAADGITLHLLVLVDLSGRP